MIVRICIALCIACMMIHPVRAQEIEAKLSGHKAIQGFTIKDDNGNTLFTVRGTGNVGLGTSSPDFLLRLQTGGILATGGYNSGISLPTIPQGAGFVWYPKRGALRSGYQDPSYTATGQMGTTSIGCGFKPHATGSCGVALGYLAKATEDYTTAIGTSPTASGRGAMAIGTGVVASGEYSTAMGRYVSTNGHDGTFMIGDLNATVVMNATRPNRFYARFENGYVLYTKSDRSTGVYAFNGATSWSSVSDSTRKENFLAVDEEIYLDRFRDLRLGSWNFIGDDHRHYGPMAQEWYSAFGHDGIGSIGDDTTLASADVDGVLCIAVKALERRTSDLKNALSVLRASRAEVVRLREKVSALEKQLAQVQENSKRIDALMILLHSHKEEAHEQRSVLSAYNTRENAR